MDILTAEKSRNYKDCPRLELGLSDIAALTVAGMSEDGSGAVAALLNFGGDGDYSAYLADDSTQIPGHYTRALAFRSWAKVFDDFGRMTEFSGRRIEFWRAGDFGLIVRIEGEPDAPYKVILGRYRTAPAVSQSVGMEKVRPECRTQGGPLYAD